MKIQTLPRIYEIAHVRGERRIKKIFHEYKHTTDVVLHVAAHKHVPLMQAKPEEAPTNNVAVNLVSIMGLVSA